MMQDKDFSTARLGHNNKVSADCFTANFELYSSSESSTDDTDHPAHIKSVTKSTEF